ncbi:glycosyltransferase family 39 protein [Pelagibacteraceae bacterium]|jgi:hypothetical protein|nr:glycosyltransferase family 39 protein [Pelagibacteraceae bacterium]
MFLKKKYILKNLYTQNLYVSFFFITYLIIGVFISKDYGIAFDEDMQRDLGQNRIDYINNFFSRIFSSTNSIDSINIKFPEYGALFEVFALWVENIINISDSRSQYFLRHYLIFFISFIGSIFFYFLALKRFSSWKLALLGTLFLISSPRIFASGFFNSKDIIFMYFFIANIFFSIAFLERPNFKNGLLFAIFSAMCVGIRVAGVLVPFLILFFIFIKSLRKDYDFKITKYIFSFAFFFVFFVIIFWPSLWENPIDNFINSILSFKSYDHPMYNFYLGKYIHSTTIHWFYIPLWISITTPIIVLLFFVYGFLLSIRRLFIRLININFKNDLNDLWRGPNELQDIIFLSLLFFPVFFIVILNSTLYSGWRHVYFLYPLIVLISLSGLKILYNKLHINKFVKIKKILTIVIFLSVTFNFHWLYKSHPFQNSYFNLLAGEKPHSRFQVDTWGLSNRFVLEKLIKEDKKNQISLSAISVTPLGLNFEILKPEQKRRIKYSSTYENSDYIINNGAFIWGDYHKIKKLPANFDLYYELLIDDILITTIYKRNDLL